jgi:hypothetical protein
MNSELMVPSATYRLQFHLFRKVLTREELCAREDGPNAWLRLLEGGLDHMRNSCTSG